MPELPEVETIVQQLQKEVLHHRITHVEVLDKKVADSHLLQIFPAQVVQVFRRAKTIVLELDNQKFLFVHLRLTGHFHLLRKGSSVEELPDQKFIAAKFYLDNGSLLTFNDIRRFGFVKVLNNSQLQKELEKFGPEPLGKNFTEEKLQQSLAKKPQANIKVTLMDQSVLAGLGNIYAQEALYHAGIDPRRKINTLTASEIQQLYHQIQEVLRLAVKHHGTTVENYVHIEGSGGFQNYLAVYQKSSCPKKHPLKKISLGGRGTSYCPKCQR